MRAFILGLGLMSLSFVTQADDAISNYSNERSVGSTALSKVILSTSLDSVSTLMSICSPISGKGVTSASEREIVAATGYDLTAIPYDVLDAPSEFCSCAIRVAAESNKILARRLGVSGFSSVPRGELHKTAMLQHKGSTGSTSCRSGPWRLDFTSYGIALFYNGTPVYGGSNGMIAGKTVNTNSSVSQSWAE